MTTINNILPKEYGYVIGSGVFSALVLQFLGGKVTMARTKLGVPYPYMYADQAIAEKDKDKYLFNCIQRGHQNALETYPQILFTLFVGGLKHPLISSAAGVGWSVGRVLYALGYNTGKPDKRYNYGGFVHHLAMLTLLGTTLSFTGTLLRWIK